VRKRIGPIWLATDGLGQIEEISRAAAELLGVRTRGHNLFLFFPMNVAEMASDIEKALDGYPGRRVVMLEPLARRPLLVQYELSTTRTADGVKLHWFFDVVVAASLQRFH
jgi:hypothetical protein